MASTPGASSDQLQGGGAEDLGRGRGRRCLLDDELPHNMPMMPGERIMPY